MFGEKLKQLRKENKISQQRLAELLGVGQSTVAMWERGKNCPEHQSLLKLAEIFNTSIDFLTDRSSHKQTFKIPVLGYVRAGLPSTALEEVLDYEFIALSSDAKDYFALKIKGDSMAPRILEGDVVIVKKEPTFSSGDICVALVGNSEATVKKIIKKDTGIILMPLNPSYEPLFFTPEEVETTPVTIIGRVTELRAKI